MKLQARLLEKPWGQIHIRNLQGAQNDVQIGEVCFEHPGSAPLPVMIKYLYTSERLSIQVHPDNDQARARGHACGKDEMWIVLDAQPTSRIGLGLKRKTSDQEVREAMLDGSIEKLVDWRPVSRGDVIYNPAGTIHAAGAGLVLLEVQQAIDLTYRLYDYGRPRELHLEEGLSVARCEPHRGERDCKLPDEGSSVLVTGPHFGAAWCNGAIPAEVPFAADHYQLAVIEGEALTEGVPIRSGECGLARRLGDVRLLPGSVAVLAWPAAEPAAEELARAA